MRKKYLQPDITYIVFGTEDVLGSSATITDTNGDHLQPWEWN